MSKIIIFAAIVFLFAIPLAYGQLWVDTSWVQFFSTDAGTNTPVKIALDSNGNVIAIGNHRLDYSHMNQFIVNYSYYGDLNWSNGFESPYYYSNTVNSIVLDNNHNAYIVCGMSGDILIAKYLANGDTSWVRSLRMGDDCFGRKIMLDGDGNIIIAGSYHTEVIDQVLLIKYYPNGDLAWIKPQNQMMWPIDAVMDSQGNICVTGLGFGDIATAKYSPDGDSLWMVRYNGPANGYDQPSKMAIDSNDNIIITGCTNFDYRNRSSGDMVTMKYNPSGDTLWTRIVNGSEFNSLLDISNDVLVDNGGNVYITGSIMSEELGQLCLTKEYDPNGGDVWTRIFSVGSSGSEGRALTLDNLGNLYVTGLSNEQIATFSYDLIGELRWSKLYSPGYGPCLGGNDIAVDYIGNVIVTGECGDSTASDMVTIKYHQTRIGIDDNPLPEKLFSLSNYPNPFNSTTRLSYDIPFAANVAISVYNMLGQKVAVLADGFQNAGSYKLNWNADKIPSGIYFVRINFNQKSEIVKTVLLK